MLAYSPTPSTLSTPMSQPLPLYPEQRHQRTNSSPTSPLRKAISLSFFRGDRKRESAPVASTSAAIMAAAAPVARRARRSMSMTRKRSKGSMLPEGLLPEAVDEEAASPSILSSSPVQAVASSSSSPATSAAPLPLSHGVKTFSRRMQRRLSLVMSTAPDWSDLSSASSGSSSAPPSRRPSTAISAASTLSSSPLRRKASLQGSFMPASWNSTIHSSSPSSEAGSRPRSRLTRKVSEESFRCRGLETEEEDLDEASLNAFFASYAEAGVHVTQNDVTMLGQAENKENVYRHGGAEDMDEDFGITTPRARILTPAALRMNDFTLSAFNEAPAPSALSLRRRISPKSQVSPPLAPLNLNLSNLQSGIPARPVERPGSLYYISPAPSSIASFSAAGHDDDDEDDDDSLSIADSEVSHPTSAWSAACPPTPPSAIRLQLRFFGALPGVEAPMDLSTGEQLTAPVPAIFVQSGASTLELKEMVVEKLISRGVSLTPRDLILSSTTPASEECNSALGLAFSSSPTASSPRSPTFKTFLGRELVNDRLLYEQGLLEDDTISVRVRPAYAQTFF